MNFKEKKFVGFSLAEALITLLIISLIALASVPVITKKHRLRTQNETKSTEHGKWICTLNSSGKHVYWQTGDANYDNIDKWKVAGTKCTFTVPQKGSNFMISASAGGGGGASPSHENICYYTAGTHQIKYPGKYTLFALGSGGCGGGAAGGCRSQGGGAGGISFGNIDVTNTDKSFVLSPGSTCNSGEDRNHAGANGKTSSISIIDAYNTSLTLIEAYGGKGGGRGERKWEGGNNTCKYVGNTGKQGSGKITSNRVYNGGTSATYKNSSYVDAPEFNKFFHELKYTAESGYLKTRYLNYGFLFGPPLGACNHSDGYWMADKENSGKGLGSGGPGRKDFGEDEDNGGTTAGTKGSTQIGANICYQAEAGRAGQAVAKQLYPSLDSTKYDVIIGAGGAGGKQSTNPEEENGQNGGNTSVVGLFILSGGIGGKQDKFSGKADTVIGLDGENSLFPYETEPIKSYGGLSGDNTSLNGLTGNGFGSGGGSGACEQKNASDFVAYNPNIGNGGRGQNGVVIVEW